MFNNTGNKIKTTVKIFTWIEILLFAFTGIAETIVGVLIEMKYFNIQIPLINADLDKYNSTIGINLIILGAITFIVGIIFVLIINMFFYGYGEIISKTSSIEEKVNRMEIFAFNSLNEQSKINVNLKNIIDKMPKNSLEQSNDNNGNEENN